MYGSGTNGGVRPKSFLNSLIAVDVSNQSTILRFLFVLSMQDFSTISAIKTGRYVYHHLKNDLFPLDCSILLGQYKNIILSIMIFSPSNLCELECSCLIGWVRSPPTPSLCRSSPALASTSPSTCCPSWPLWPGGGDSGSSAAALQQSLLYNTTWVVI